MRSTTHKMVERNKIMSRKSTIQKVLLGLIILCSNCYISILFQLSRHFENVISQQKIAPRQDAQNGSPSTEKLNLKQQLSFWHINRVKGEELLRRKGPSTVRRPLMAYLEPKLNDTIPGTGWHGDLDPKVNDRGIPPDFYIPLPLRTNTPQDLIQYQYPHVQTCQDLPTQFPIDRGLVPDVDPHTGHSIIRNLLDEPTPLSYPWDEATFCPVEADPFLPWIHDVFPSIDGSRIEFVAQNRRRCQTGKNHFDNVDRLTPQVALLQPVSVQRINQTEAQRLAPSLWDDATTTITPRYRLAPLEEASEDGMWTRFICRFHTTDFTTQQTLVLDETLSRYHFNYDYVGYRKNQPSLLTPRGADGNMFWTSTLLFYCPVPDNLQQLISREQTILSDGTPTLHVDVIPMRTSVRYGGAEAYFTEDMAGPKIKWATNVRDNFKKNSQVSMGFDPRLRWGSNHVLPKVEASGRWSNIPICRPPSIPETAATRTSQPGSVETKQSSVPQTKMVPPKTKPYVLSACLWASASFHERGGSSKTAMMDTETKDRLREWIAFHLMVGIDHIYVYDNTGAYTNQTSLDDITRLFPGQVTRIDWPAQVCNNRKPGVTNPGERSSQYAAENSCRVRFGPFTEWMASFDTDEYMIPQGNFTNLKDVVRQAQAQGTNILSFSSARAMLRVDATEEIESSRVKKGDATFLEAYNCDPVPLPKPSWAQRARKQIYRPDYVYMRFVHYSTVTKGLIESYVKYHNRTPSPLEPWITKYIERTERVTDEVNEAVMLHTKTIDAGRTKNYALKCHKSWTQKHHSCWVGYPWPNNNTSTDGYQSAEGNTTSSTYNDDGMLYNCYANKHVEKYWVPRLRQQLGLR